MINKLGRLLLATVLGLGLVVAFSPAAWACSCVGYSPSQSFAAADVVLVGTVVAVEERDPIFGEPTRITRLHTERVYKGRASAVQNVISARQEPSCGGVDHKIGSRWLIFGLLESDGITDPPAGKLSTNRCLGNVAGDVVPTTFGPGSPPQAGVSVVPVDRTAIGWILGGVVTGSLLTATGVWLFLRRSRHLIASASG